VIYFDVVHVLPNGDRGRTVSTHMNREAAEVTCLAYSTDYQDSFTVIRKEVK
jgi:hypothetical protein